jgi:hypothetical protein
LLGFFLRRIGQHDTARRAGFGIQAFDGGDNRELQSVSFEVRGGGVRPRAATQAEAMSGTAASRKPPP